MKEKTQTIDHWRQFNHDMSTHAALYGREHGCTSNDMTDDQIWLPESVSRVTVMVRAPPTC